MTSKFDLLKQLLYLYSGYTFYSEDTYGNILNVPWDSNHKGFLKFGSINKIQTNSKAHSQIFSLQLEATSLTELETLEKTIFEVSNDYAHRTASNIDYVIAANAHDSNCAVSGLPNLQYVPPWTVGELSELGYNRILPPLALVAGSVSLLHIPITEFPLAWVIALTTTTVTLKIYITASTNKTNSLYVRGINVDTLGAFSTYVGTTLAMTTAVLTEDVSGASDNAWYSLDVKTIVQTIQARTGWNQASIGFQLYQLAGSGSNDIRFANFDADPTHVAYLEITFDTAEFPMRLDFMELEAPYQVNGHWFTTLMLETEWSHE
jgi:hypothetical protein